jgi:acetamidase/formamidase
VARHELPLDRRLLHGHFSRELEPVVTIDPGDSVRISVPNAGWRLESGELFEPRSDELDAGHALAGPIEFAARGPGRRSPRGSTACSRARGA